MLPENWNELTADERLEARLSGWASTADKQFTTPEAAQAYAERAKRFVDVLKLRQPDRIPRLLLTGDCVANFGGLTQGDMFYDYPKAVEAINKFHRGFDLDYSAASNFFPGKVYDRLGYKLYRLPGSTLKTTQTFQFVEREYMHPDEYDALIANPEGWLMRTYMPRVMGEMGGWQFMPNMLGTTELPFVPFMMVNFTIPPLQESLQTVAEVAQAILEWLDANAQAGAVSMGELGLPATLGGFTKAPFDYLGDSLRGTRGVMTDMYRHPQKLLAAVERLVPLAIDMGVNAANGSGNPFAFIPLHKGADGFMSDANFQKFYWPTLKDTLLGLIQEGVAPLLFVEGGYNQRLDVIAGSGLPAGRTIWLFDKTDMTAAKQKFGSWACFGGNIPASMFKTGTLEQITDYVKQLIDTCAPGGGFILSPGAVLDHVEESNVHAYLKAGKEFGVYTSTKKENRIRLEKL